MPNNQQDNASLALKESQEKQWNSQLDQIVKLIPDTQDKKIAIASKQVKIANERDPEQALRNVIAHVCLMSGVEPPSGIQELVLIDFATKYFMDLTAQEIKLAFEQNILGVFGETVQHYQDVNPQFFSKVISEYRIRKRAAMISFTKATNQLMAHQEPARIDPDSAFNGLMAYYRERKEFPQTWNYSAVFDFMLSSKLADSQEELKAFKKQNEGEVRSHIEKKIKTSANLIERHQLQMQLAGNYVNMEIRKRYVQMKIKQLAK